MNKKTLIIVGMIFALAAIITFNLVMQPGIKDLEGGFVERVFIRNEQNDGPIIRIYAVTVAGEYWQQMQDYGNYMPHTKYGTTKVFFFDANKPFPSKMELTEPHFSPEFKNSCLGLYEKDGMSQLHFTRYPFR